MASFADKVAALLTFLGVLPSMPMLQALHTMNEMMGIVGEGPLAQCSTFTGMILVWERFLILFGVVWYCGMESGLRH